MRSDSHEQKKETYRYQHHKCAVSASGGRSKGENTGASKDEIRPPDEAKKFAVRGTDDKERPREGGQGDERGLGTAPQGQSAS